MTDVLDDDRATADTKPRETGEPFLVVENLTVTFPTHDGLVQAVSDLSYSVEMGKTLGIVGESGSGKSVSSMAVLGLHDIKRTHLTGSIRVGGTEIVGASQSTMKRIRGTEVAMIFQDALSALHPFFTIGAQITEAYRLHNKVSKSKARTRAIEMLDLVGIPQPDRRVDDYPHQFSGGMRQRAMIAMSLVNNPRLLIADEPTTALDVTVQAQILDLMRALQKDFQSSIVMITHNLGVVSQMADHVAVMYLGKIVEYAAVRDIFHNPLHPYTIGLLNSVPVLGRKSRKQLVPIRGMVPSPTETIRGCPFAARCPHVMPICREELPPLREVQLGHKVACWLHE